MSFDSTHSFKASPGVIPIAPWQAFDKVWMSVTGYHANEFKFAQGVTPMSTLTETVGMIVLYLVVIFGGREFMRNREPLKLNGLFKAHNLFLTLLSGGLLVLFIEQLVPTIWKHGLYQNICDAEGWTDELVTLYYLNYITKYIELIDTVFLMVKKKPLTFLHTYHHPATALLCYTQLIGHTSVSWVPITLNLTVHVVMYWYYFQSARGVKVWWKEWITRMQIGQFILDLGFVYFASWDYYASAHAPYLPHLGRCAGEPFAAICGCLILSSYLVLFIMFYIATYKKSSSRKANTKSDKAAVSSMKQSAAKVADSCSGVEHMNSSIVSRK
ncbi:GNS1/SUR4 membrane protein [Daldinia caldariorum]|uniref:GNS1/SUR4 membrane protein n=1 Tax=Daldinia caldariorum TaxID=326644 RepID=UPI002008DEFD|nr:GNS1/SUR4 membrane protein [Daldinia caldariorum]KAI1463219.1 GNS1/SUR4 membrane protein [Daldinia caldariorum]